jgi:hypothetical protein
MDSESLKNASRQLAEMSDDELRSLLHLQIRLVVNLMHGSNYAAGQAIAEATGEPLKTAIARVDRLTSASPPEYLRKLEQMLGALGYRIEIVRK